MGFSDINASTLGKENMTHSLTAKNRSNITVSGVNDVPEFDDTTVLLATSAGNMALTGRELRIKVLDTSSGVVEVEGRLDGVAYYDAQDKDKKKNRLGRLFG